MCFASASSKFEESILHWLDKKTMWLLNLQIGKNNKFNAAAFLFCISSASTFLERHYQPNMLEDSIFSHWSANLPTLLVQESYARILEERKHAQHPPGDALRPTSSTQKSSKASSKIVALDALEGEVQELVR